MKRFNFWAGFTAMSGVAVVAVAEIVSSRTTQTNTLPGSVPPPARHRCSGPDSVPRMAPVDVNAVRAMPPGVYLTKPYTCMLMVPGGVDDGIFQHHPPLPNPPMQILRPDLKLVPLGWPGR